MARHAISGWCLVAFVTLTVVTLSMPPERGSRHLAEPEPGVVTPNTELVAAACPLFISFRPGDFLADEVSKAVLETLPTKFRGEVRLHVRPADVTRVTFAVLRLGTVQIVRTTRASDAERLRQVFEDSHFGVSPDRSIPSDGGRRSRPREKQTGGKTICHWEELDRWTRGWCWVDKNTFMTGNVAAIQSLLESKDKPSAAIASALALAPDHSLLVAVDGERLGAMLRGRREDEARERKLHPPGGYKDRAKPRFEPGEFRGVKSSWIRLIPAAKPETGRPDREAVFASLGGGVELLPYKPLLSAKSGLLTMDVRKVVTLQGRLELHDEKSMDDGEMAFKTLLFVGRELAELAPKADAELAGMRALGGPVRKAIEAAKVERKGTALSFTINLRPDVGLPKAIREAFEKEKKRWEGGVPGKDRSPRPRPDKD